MTLVTMNNELRTMNKKTLSKRQFALIDELFNADLSEQQVLEKYQVSRNLFNKWLGDELFVGEYERRIASARLAGQALIARYSLIAAAKLLALTESENPETARKACLDVISLPASSQSMQCPDGTQNDKQDHSEQLSPQLAQRLLAALAEEKNSQSSSDK